MPSKPSIQVGHCESDHQNIWFYSFKNATCPLCRELHHKNVLIQGVKVILQKVKLFIRDGI